MLLSNHLLVACYWVKRVVVYQCQEPIGIPVDDLASEAFASPHLHEDVAEEIRLGGNVGRIELAEVKDKLAPITLDVVALQLGVCSRSVRGSRKCYLTIRRACLPRKFKLRVKKSCSLVAIRVCR